MALWDRRALGDNRGDAVEAAPVSLSTDWAPVIRSVWVCALYGIPALAGAYLAFVRRDVAGG